MIARNGFAELGLPKEGLRAAPIVSETNWGCVIRPAEPLLERAALIEIAATFVGILLLFAAFGQWLLPGTDFSPAMLPMKSVSTAIFAALGVALIWTGRRGLIQEMHIDRGKAELRLVQRNHCGQGRLVGLYAFNEVASVVLLRSKTPLTPTRLCLRLASNGAIVDLLPSSEEELLPIRNRLIAEMSPRFRSPAARREPLVKAA